MTEIGTLVPHQAQYIAWQLSRRAAADSVESLGATLVDAAIDLNPHQVEAALFACRNPLSRGVILADEVGLGKTIEAGLVISQQWAERKRRILIIVPANLRKQWHQELQDKFNLQGLILEAKNYNTLRKAGTVQPFLHEGGPVICSYQFAKARADDLKRIGWDLVVMDEAHRLRNVYKPGNVIACTLRDALDHVDATRSQSQRGSVLVANNDGALDWGDFEFRGARYEILRGYEGDSIDDCTVWGAGFVDRAVLGRRIELVLADALAELEQPFNPVLYPTTHPITTHADQPVPVTLGLPFGVEGVRQTNLQVGPDAYAWQTHDGVAPLASGIGVILSCAPAPRWLHKALSGRWSCSDHHKLVKVVSWCVITLRTAKRSRIRVIKQFGAHLSRRASGVPRDTAQCGAVTLIQRFGSALNLNVHFHMLWLDGVYEDTTEPPQRKRRLNRTRAPTSTQLTELAGTIAHRVCRHLTRKGWLEGEDESVFLSDSAGSDDGMDGMRMNSITYRIATGRDAGRKVATLQTLPGDAGPLEGDAGKVGGFSLHAGVAAEAHESRKLEKLCRYITRPAISEQRLSISPQGRVRYALKTPWRNSTTHVEWDAVDFVAKLAALVPPPRAHLTRFHGIFAPNAALRAQLTPSGRGKRPATDAAAADVRAINELRSPEQKRRAMNWAQHLKRVFGIDISTCIHCGGAVRIVASIEEPTAIRAILAHFEKHGALEEAHYWPAARAPPTAAA